MVIRSPEITKVKLWLESQEDKFINGTVDVGNHLLPVSNAVYDLGSSTKKWRSGYFSNLYTGDLKVNGAEVYTIRVVTVTSNYTASNGDVVLADASAGAITVTLPTPTTGAVINVKKIDSSANAVTIDGAGATIDGESSFQITKQYESYTLVSDGSNWFIV